MIYCFDLDGTLCTLSNKNNYIEALPIPLMIDAVNKLYNSGHYIKIFTARGASSGIDWTVLTKQQLTDWNIKHHELIMNSKPSYDIFVDDKAYNADFWKNNFLPIKKGVITGNFDIIHPGYIDMFEQAKMVCNHLTVLLHSDPSIERPNKIKPILNTKDRSRTLLSIKYIDEIIGYTTEIELEDLLRNYSFDIRILGEDYINKEYTGKNLCNETFFMKRDHGWSTTKFKNLIRESR
jgi:glycerol-3-phosphate cytidylyltransferase